LTGLDTNVLVRFFAQDDPRQSLNADEVMRSLTAESQGFVGLAALLELVWVLGSKHRFDSIKLTRAIDQLLSQDEIVVEQAETVESALRLYRNGRADFADCLISASAQAAGCSRTVTLDRKAARDASMELLAQANPPYPEAATKLKR
jgi:predicted nucleic-acid-binding protein